MSELTTIARPYAKAAFDFAIEQSAVEKWTEMLGFYLWRTIGSIWAKSYSVNG